MSLIILNVDEVRRTLSASGGAFVVHDKEVDIVRFALNTGFTDVVLDEHSALRVMYQRPGETEVRAQTLTYYDTDGLRNYYDWQLHPSDLAKNGTLTVALCILRTDTEAEEWHTTPCQVRVLDSIHTDDSDEGDETITPTVAQRVAVLESVVKSVAGGAPVVVDSASDMTDTDRVYVLTTDSKWYYYDGSAWIAGGEYGGVATGSITTDKLADGAVTSAKIAGGAVTADKLSDDAKIALLTCFEHVAWADERGAEYVETLETALMMTYPMLFVLFDSGDIAIYDDYALNDLRQFLSVRYYESSGASYDITEYELFGELDSAKSQITVTYANISKIITIDVIVGRPLALSDITGHIGYSNFAIDANGNISFSSAKTYSLISLNPSIKHIRFTPSHTNETRLDVSARVASANLGNGQFICSDHAHVFVFTQSGDLYTAQNDDTQATIEVENWSGHDTDIRRRDVTLSNGVLRIVDADNPEVYKTVTNADIIGFWDNSSTKYKPQLVRVYNN